MSKEIKDTRTASEQTFDLTDQRLFDFYHRNHLFEAREGTTYSREDVLDIARNAYWFGLADRAKDPDGTALLAEEIQHLLKGA